MILPASWDVLRDETQSEYFTELTEFVDAEREAGVVYPPKEQVFAAFEATAFEDLRVLLLGQDPYHGPGQAHGLCFSVQRGVKVPPSLRNIYKELAEDVGCEGGTLTPR